MRQLPHGLFLICEKSNSSNAVSYTHLDVYKRQLSDKTECLPAFIAVAMTILTYNIANGMALSIVSYLILKLAAGKGKEVPKSMYVIGVCMLFYLYTLV